MCFDEINMHAEKGHYIVVEGLEGAGKSTAIKTIRSFLSDKVGQVSLVREPGGTGVGEALRHIIKEIETDEIIDPKTELLLMYAARVQLLEQVIKPSLERGDWILADRNELSSFAYQGGGRKMSMSFIKKLSDFCLNGFKPDLVIFLEVSPQRGLKRAMMRGSTDRIEQESLAFFQEVYNTYHKQLQHMENVVIINAAKPLKEVQQAIRNALTTYMNKQNTFLSL
tara:strand:+ start:792 stop:1466 length:675 start_codon:yes stop_codon:yes gene_type:complete